MNFELTPEQRDIQKAAREFATAEFDKDLAIEHELNHSFPEELWRKASKLGFAGIHFPEEYGGQGYGLLEKVLVVEEFCRQDSGIGMALSLVELGSEIILVHGNEEQKKKYLIPVATGEAISAAAFTEPEHGSDITFLSTVATKDKDGYQINGTKIFITNGCIASFTVVLCQTDLEAKPSYRGQSTLIVEKGQEGFDATELENKMGMRMNSTAELSFVNVKVPAENLVGDENRGFYNMMDFVNESRPEIGALALGIAQGAFDRALNYAKQRKQFGQRIADFQVIQHKLADMATKIEASRLLLYKAARNFDKGKIDPKISSMAKWFSARSAVEVTEEAVQILGGHGYMLENEVERFYRDARVTEIVEGTREIQKNNIARLLIGKIS